MRSPKNRFPPGWDEARVRCVLEHYEQQTEEEAMAEDEAALKSGRGSVTLSEAKGPSDQILRPPLADSE